MGSQLCNSTPENHHDLPVEAQRPIEIHIEKQTVSSKKGSLTAKQLSEGNQLFEASSFPLVNKHVEQRIKKLTKRPNNPNKVWKIRNPINIIYANTDEANSVGLPKGYVQLYKLKDNGDFQGYFEGHLDSGYEPILNQNCIFVFPNASYFVGTGKNQGKYVNEVTRLSYSGGWQDYQPQGQGEQKNNKGVYVGQYHLGQKQGKGQFKWNEDDKLTFEGLFTKGLFNGKGIIQDSKNKYTYEGEFKNGQKHGYGTEKQQFQIYEGYFYKGQRCGRGKLKILNASDKTLQTIFQGNFYQGVPNGRGKVSKPNKQVVQGIWEDGHLIAVQ